jgi:hypothetical protein
MSDTNDTTKHTGLPVHGYEPQSSTNVALVNHFKQTEERLLREIDVMRDGPGIEPRFDQRWLSIAQSHFEQGFMALNRSVFKPSRVRLPGDEK